MKRLGIFLTLILLISLISPLSSGMLLLSFKTDDVIKVLPGDYYYGYLKVENPAVDFKLVSFRSYRITDSAGNDVDFFNFTLKERNYGGWRSGETREIYYNISCAEGTKPGVYTLSLRFLGTTVKGQLQLIDLQTSIYVVESPVEFDYAQAYVKERPSSPYALRGETIIVFAHLRNIGHRPIPVTERITVLREGKVYFSEEAKKTLKAGENVLTTEVPVDVKWEDGSYLLKYTVSYRNETHTYTKEFPVRLGIKIVGVSIKRSEIESGSENVVYATVTSEREGNVNFHVESLAGGELIGSYDTVARVSPGTEVFKFSVPTNVTGEITVNLSATFLGVFLGSFTLHYLVTAPPEFLNLTYEKVDTDEVEFTLVVLNPNPWDINGSVSYRISSAGDILYKDSVAASFKPGENVLKLNFKLPLEQSVDYEFVLSAMGKSDKASGSLYLPKPTPTTTSTTTSTSTTSPSNTTSSQPDEGSSLKTFVVLLAAGFLVLVGAYFLTRGESKKKRRERPKPKRSSPLGRFKPPKPPRFLERRELPKKK